jgi:hypothetical protein
MSNPLPRFQNRSPVLYTLGYFYAPSASKVMSREIGLVSCVSSKRDTPAPPLDLYTSPYFEKMRCYADSHHDDWWILSAEHGLLDPDGPEIDP